MAPHGSINIVVAHKPEAECLIQVLGLQKDSMETGILKNGEIRLMLSGTGIAAAQQACKHLYQFNSGPDYWLNFGVVGSGQFQQGTFVKCDRFILQDEVIEFKDSNGYSVNLPSTSVTTVSRPERGFSEGGVFDMEAHAIARFVKDLQQPLVCIKLVSDGPGTPEQCLTPGHLKQFLIQQAPRQMELFRVLLN